VPSLEGPFHPPIFDIELLKANRIPFLIEQSTGAVCLPADSRSSQHSSSATCLRYPACWFEPTRPQSAGHMWYLLPTVAVNNRPSAAFFLFCPGST
jgi:hypothetical protein